MAMCHNYVKHLKKLSAASDIIYIKGGWQGGLAFSVYAYPLVYLFVCLLVWLVRLLLVCASCQLRAYKDTARLSIYCISLSYI